MRRTGKRKATEGEREKEARTVAILGAGALASVLAQALQEAGYRVTEVISRPRPSSMRRARILARKVGAKAVTVERAALDSCLLWLCVPDRDIGAAAGVLAARLNALQRRGRSAPRFAFHSSGALPSSELGALRGGRIAVASVHPLMTFVEGRRVSLTGVPFALEGDGAATKRARRMVRELGGKTFPLPARRKHAYHAWATMTSPLLVAYLVALEETARGAGLSRSLARRVSLPIIRQTLANYATLGPPKSFSGPLIRGDVQTVAKHLSVLHANPLTRAVYVALVKVALDGLPGRNRDELRRLLGDQL